MELTIFTLIITVFWVSIFVKIISSLRKQMAVLHCFSISADALYIEGNFSLWIPIYNFD